MQRGGAALARRSLRPQHHKSAKLDPKVGRREVVGLMIRSFTTRKKSLLLVIARYSRPANLDDIHVITGRARLSMKNKPLLKQFLLRAREVCSLRHFARRIRFLRDSCIDDRVVGRCILGAIPTRDEQPVQRALGEAFFIQTWNLLVQVVQQVKKSESIPVRPRRRSATSTATLSLPLERFRESCCNWHDLSVHVVLA